jgi:hypothetical protein
MPGVFDRLQRQIDDKSGEGGISALDIAALPPALRKIMRLMLREMEIGYAALAESMQSLPEGDRLSPQELDESLHLLTDQQWLIRLGEGERATYKVNLRRKPGSTLAGDIWGTLDQKLGKNPPEKPKPGS